MLLDISGRSYLHRNWIIRSAGSMWTPLFLDIDNNTSKRGGKQMLRETARCIRQREGCGEGNDLRERQISNMDGEFLVRRYITRRCFLLFILSFPPKIKIRISS